MFEMVKDIKIVFGKGPGSRPFVLAKDVTQVFYVQDVSSKPRKDKSRNKSSFLGAGMSQSAILL